MKRFIYLATCQLLLTSTSAMAGKGELFKVDDAAIEQEFADLNRLEDYVTQGED